LDGELWGGRLLKDEKGGRERSPNLLGDSWFLAEEAGEN